MAAGEEYVAEITALESDRRARQAFQDLVLGSTVPGGCIFDFGAGPGLDAKFYAERGFRVLAYDVDARMCGYFARHCRREIESGTIELYQGEYRDFLERQLPDIRDRNPVNVVTANFAPFSLIDDPRELFAKLHALTAPGARIIASVLNPDFIGDMQYGWWWANRLNYWRTGQFHVAGASGRIFRRSRSNFAAHAAPHFTLQRVVPAPRLLTQFTFLVFARQ